MASESTKARTALAQQLQRQQGASSTTRGTGPEGGGSSRPPIGFVPGRRTLLSAVAVAVLGVGLYQFLQSGPPNLPPPPGQDAGPEYLAATLAYQPAPQLPMPPDHKTWQDCARGVSGAAIADLDLVLAIDTTGSMRGVIDDLKANVNTLITSLRTGSDTVRVGIVAYRDVGDIYVVHPYPLTQLDDDGVRRLLAFVGALTASGGGDWPEAVDEALAAAAHMNWRQNVSASVVVVGDAPAHTEDASAAFDLAHDFASGPQRGQVSVIDTGSGAAAFMRSLPKRGGGQYVTYDGHILNSLLPAITACPSR